MDMIATTNGTTPTPGTTALILSVPETERNGVLKWPKYPQVVVGCGGDVVYKECLKNHAASSGGHALDGCGEFMPARTATATDPTSLKCAACGCHRNFHRREQLSPTSAAAAAATTRLIEYHPQHRHHPPPPLPTLPGATSPGSDDDQSPPPISSAYYPTSAPQMLLALSDNAKINTASAAAAVAADNNGVCHQQQQQQQQQQQMFSSVSPHLSSRKRFRTKFSPDQKERMQEFAEKLGWKMQKSTDELVKGFCNDIGVQREVFKVWMHNNKNTFGRRSASKYVITSTNQGVNPIKEDYENVNENGIGIGVGNSHSSSINNSNCISDHHQQQFNNGRSHHSNAAPTNASSSSS